MPDHHIGIVAHYALIRNQETLGLTRKGSTESYGGGCFGSDEFTLQPGRLGLKFYVATRAKAEICLPIR